MTDEKTGGTCGCCGQPAAACEKPVQFGKDFRYWIIQPDDPGLPPTGDELVHAAIELDLDPRLAPLGKETGFSFGPRRYPLCRVNATKGIAFHGTMKADALIVRSTADRTFRLATGTLRRTALSAALDR